MKNRFLILCAAVLLVALAACKKESTETTTTTSATDTTATTSTYDTGGTSGTTATTATTVTSGTTTSSTLSDDDKKFMTKAAEGGIAEVELSTVAAQKATNADVKTFANRMVTDHSKANDDELKQLAGNKGVTLPTATDKEHKELEDKLTKEKAGPKYDKAYMEAMVKDHGKVVDAFTKESKDAKDADLKSWVSNTLPTVQDHLKMAKETAGKLK